MMSNKLKTDLAPAVAGAHQAAGARAFAADLPVGNCAWPDEAAQAEFARGWLQAYDLKQACREEPEEDTALLATLKGLNKSQRLVLAAAIGNTGDCTGDEHAFGFGNEIPDYLGQHMGVHQVTGHLGKLTAMGLLCFSDDSPDAMGGQFELSTDLHTALVPFDFDLSALIGGAQ